MSNVDDIERRLRDSRPVTEIACPPLSSLVERIEGTGGEPRRHRRSGLSRLALPMALGVLVLAAASAGAALLISFGQDRLTRIRAPSDTRGGTRRARAAELGSPADARA